jgi:lipopolysaccharide export LptBFGC system permease protein LptF
MSWARAFRLVLHLLPAELRRKHGPAMEALFARDLGRARARGLLHGALAGAAGIWDVARRGVYERLRAGHGASRERCPPERCEMDAGGPQPARPDLGRPEMPQLTTRQLLLRHAASFAITFVALTASLLARFATRQVSALSARGAPAGTIAGALLLAVPFTAAMTIPMAVLVAVLREFTRLGADRTLAVGRRERAGVRHLVVPLLVAAAGIGALELVVAAELVPRANERLVAVLAGGAAGPRSARTMTIGELRQAVRSVCLDTEPFALSRAAAYEVEVQKKFALPAACVVMALAGVAIALRVPRGGAGLVIAASCAVFGAYYVVLMTGEDLAHRLVVSPFIGMWGANVLLLAAALVALWRRNAPVAPSASGAVVTRG